MHGPGNPAAVLEVIACSVADALEAEKGGAGRLEITRDLACGGLTPAFALIREIRSAVSLPIRVLLRESPSYLVPSSQEIERLCEFAQRLPEIGVEGAVFGFLSGGKIDCQSLIRLQSLAPCLKITFHHAFDEIADRPSAIDELRRCTNVDHVLTSGGKGGWPENTRQLSLDQRRASTQIKILVGGGLDENVIRLLCQQTSIREFHVGRAVRERRQCDGQVRASLARRIVQIFEQSAIEQAER